MVNVCVICGECSLARASEETRTYVQNADMVAETKKKSHRDAYTKKIQEQENLSRQVS